MIFQILSVFFWLSLAFLMCYSAETPKECIFGTPDYNETLCNETCTKSMHTNESYCSNFTQSTANVKNEPQRQEGGDPLALSGIKTSLTGEETQLDVTTPEIGQISDSSVSLEASLKGSAFASFCVLLFAYF